MYTLEKLGCTLCILGVWTMLPSESLEKLGCTLCTLGLFCHFALGDWPSRNRLAASYCIGRHNPASAHACMLERRGGSILHARPGMSIYIAG